MSAVAAPARGSGWRPDFWTLVAVGAWAILIVLLLIPLGLVLISSFRDESGQLTLANWQRLFTSARYFNALINTLIVGFGGLAGHWFLNAPADFPGPMGRLWVRQSLSAVTGACLLVSREALSRVGPLDEVNFAIAYNDVDLCLRLLEIGKRVVWTPFAALRHHESASRGSDETPENIARFQFEQANLRARHRTDQYRDFAINAWYMDDRSTPEWRPLKHLPPAK